MFAQLLEVETLHKITKEKNTLGKAKHCILVFVTTTSLSKEC